MKAIEDNVFYLTFGIVYKQIQHYHCSPNTYQLIKPLQLDHGFVALGMCGKMCALELVSKL